MALTCYDIYKSVNIPFYTASWWSYLIDALILLQRLIYSLVGLMACITLSEAYHDTIHITPAIHVSSSGLTAGQQVSN
ncbi:hypothetical protein CEUSTIGMA_g9009.t1 [Chlamydomonas eustigma]|uniref:Uncharacterized protein n=1 Tax=Chlamydomonas eustigma TaxID=1157962 RepID=A0A250XEU4_9CHLO|nr:hypothetical protein CEUSTIGMA_g9009.t1 [Chlamydomonas eustigma]|eukprot:GAX81581.1 hypothetical protein CEUSTIGMA_g9009.t1 [Chlamydomonas eustigma]